LGGGKPGYHNAETQLGRVPGLEAWDAFGKAEDYPGERWPKKCDHCPAEVPTTADIQLHTERVYNTASGVPERGDIYEVSWEHYDKDDGTSGCIYGWTNCSGTHRHAVLPDGGHWGLDGRCSNCTLPKDTEHRCWVITGSQANLTSNKAGRTCSAGAGSIVSPRGWHGFLKNGLWEP
jgi:hypothetical protein